MSDPVRMTHPLREGLAVFVAVMVSAVVAAAVAVLLLMLVQPGWRDGGDVFVGWMMASAICFAWTMLVGVPIALILVHRQRFRLLPMAFASALAGGLPPLALFLAEDLPHGSVAEAWAMRGLVIAGGALAGGAAGASFFGAHRWMCPDPAASTVTR